jgi:hypothetical protein
LPPPLSSLPSTSASLFLKKKKLGKKSVAVGFNPPELRYKLTPESSVVTAVKVAATRVLMDVANLRANFRLGKLLENFKRMNSSPREQLELKKHHCYVKIIKNTIYSHNVIPYYNFNSPICFSPF